MHNRFTKRGLTTLLLLALLIVGVAILLPIVASADGSPALEGEIEDLNYQTVNGTNVKTSEKTDLRFLFSIDNLDYTAVGFVFSTSNDPVKTGTKQSGNFTESTTVYRSVTANSTDIPAPDGRLWVAAKLSEIPHASFATYIYVRPYVEDGSGVRYGETKRINVCEALGHVHEIKNPTGNATLLTAGTRCGDCAVCGLTGIVEEGVYAAVADTLSQEKFLKGSSDFVTFDHYADVYSALTGNQKFYPVSENGMEGRDFFFQIDMLWNETMLNSIQNKFILCFYTSSDIPLFYFTPNAYADRYGKINGTISNDKGDNPWSGGFDWTNGFETMEGPIGGVGRMFDRYPNLNRSGDEQDWGWHRIGVRVHQDAYTDGENVTYSGVFYLYIDGVQRWKVSLNTAQLVSKNALLFTMDPDGTYHDNNNGNVFTFWATNLDESTSEVQMVTANLTTSAVRPSQFSAGVVPVSDPAPSKFVLKNNTAVDAKVWFMAEHNHVWDGNEVLTREATVLQAGKKAEHCKLCGAEKETGTSVEFVPTVYESVHGTFDAEASPAGYGQSKSLSSIRGSEHFYPSNGRVGRNLYFEYSILWNETLRNWDDVTEKSEMKIIQFYKDRDHHKELYLLYSRDGMTGDCPYADHFDFSCYHEYSSTGVVNGVYDNDNGTPGYQAGYDDPPLESSSPSIGAFGWHHIGVLVHQEASGDGSTVNYSGWAELYVDGVKVWKLKSDMSSLTSLGLSLFTATSKNSNLTYSDTTPNVRFRFDRFASSGSTAYALVGNVNWRIVDTDFDPTTEIEPVVSPAYVDYVIPGTDVHVNGAVYFSTPTVYSSSKSSAVPVEQMKTLDDIRGDDHFYPNASNSGEGRNLYFDYNFLWNATLHNWNDSNSNAEIRIATIQTTDSNYKSFYLLYTRDNKRPFKTSGDCPFKGHFDYSTYFPVDKPNEWTCAEDPGNGQPIYKAGWDDPITMSSSPSIGAYGWHHIGVLIHQEATPTGGTDVSYSGWSELFIDGVKVWHVQTNMQNTKGDNVSLKEKGLMLFTATAEDGVITNYTDAPSSVKIGFKFKNGFKATVEDAYAVFSNVRWRIVPISFDPTTEFEPVVSPAPTSYTLPNGTMIPASVYFQAKVN